MRRIQITNDGDGNYGVEILWHESKGDYSSWRGLKRFAYQGDALMFRAVDIPTFEDSHLKMLMARFNYNDVYRRCRKGVYKRI